VGSIKRHRKMGREGVGVVTKNKCDEEKTNGVHVYRYSGVDGSTKDAFGGECAKPECEEGQ